MTGTPGGKMAASAPCSDVRWLFMRAPLTSACANTAARPGPAAATAAASAPGSERYGSHSAPANSVGWVKTWTRSLTAASGDSACTSPAAFAWSWFPTSISAGCVQVRTSASTRFSGATGSASLACQKSPRKRTPAPRAAAAACTAASTSMHVSQVSSDTCRSLKTTQPLTAAAAAARSGGGAPAARSGGACRARGGAATAAAAAARAAEAREAVWRTSSAPARRVRSVEAAACAAPGQPRAVAGPALRQAQPPARAGNEADVKAPQALSTASRMASSARCARRIAGGAGSPCGAAGGAAGDSARARTNARAVDRAGPLRAP